LFKKKTLWNTHHPSFAEFRTAIRDFFTNLPDIASELETLLTPNFQFTGQQQNRISTA